MFFNNKNHISFCANRSENCTKRFEKGLHFVLGLIFGRVARSIQTHYLEIINYFERRSTNAASESFNAKIKNFRSQFRGVKDKAFFLFRLSKIYA